MMRFRAEAILALVWALLPGVGCRRDTSSAEGEQIVRRYLALLVDAYRTSDANLADPAVTDKEGRKLTGLIGVKLDMGIYLDARLLELEVGRVERSEKVMLIETRERWRYRDRRIGSGAQVGAESIDSYAIRYHFVQDKGHWLVDQLEFVEPPQVGRKEQPMAVDVRTAHGLPPREEQPAARQVRPPDQVPVGPPPRGSRP